MIQKLGFEPVRQKIQEKLNELIAKEEPIVTKMCKKGELKEFPSYLPKTLLEVRFVKPNFFSISQNFVEILCFFLQILLFFSFKWC